ncbi:MAG TPA: MoxR family ATPase [Armatimonadetes bacterium]|nr:MoxR family ATPase [Armatimonadota bacterium]
MVSIAGHTVVQELGSRILNEVRKVIIGQEKVIEQLLICLLARGHVLLEGVPGVAKTLMAKTMAASMGIEFKRIQFTPDLMPSDVIGTSVFDVRTASFHLKRGPIFTNILLADEINRTPPKTQAALLEAMEERMVSIDGVDHKLSEPFLVIATQNPIEYEGTYPLPEAQLDRFMMKVVVEYPSEEEELKILQQAHGGFDPHDLARAGVQQVASVDDVQSAMEASIGITVADDVLGYINQIVRTSRQLYHVSLGASPRAGIMLLKCAKVHAALRGRGFVIPDDVKAVAKPVLRHRLLIKPEAEIGGVTSDVLVDSILESVPVPR